MPQFLIGDDAAVKLTFGTTSNLGVVTFGSSSVYTCLTQKVSATDSVETINVKALCGGRKIFRSHSGSTKLDITLFTPSAGFSTLTSSRVTPIGTPLKVEILENSALTNPLTFIGIITDWKTEIAQGSPTMETLSVLCDIASN